MSSNIDDKFKNFESNSDLSEQNINFFQIENKNTTSKKNGLNKLNLNKPPKIKDKDKSSILSDSSYENEKNDRNENNFSNTYTEQQNLFNEKNKNHQFIGDIIDINEQNDNYNNQENINNYNNEIINNLKIIKNKFFNQNSNLDNYIINNNINNINKNNNNNVINVSRSMSSQRSQSSQSPKYQNLSRSRSRSPIYSPTNNKINYQFNNNNISNNYLRNNNRNNQNLGNKFQNLNSSLKKGNSSNKKFIMKNGCCRDCMKAFSKNGKSCLCQVPKKERKFHLSENGCNYCGCKGCNPFDIKLNERKIEKNQLYQDKTIFYKNQRILDSEDEDLKIKEQDVDNYNIEKREIKDDLNEILKINSIFYGYGVPLRTPSYILGYNPAYNNYSYSKKNDNNNKNDNLDLNNNNNNNNNTYNKNILNNKFRKNNYNYGNNLNTNNNINMSGMSNLNNQMFKNK